jgi:hypothetical protein
MKLTGENLSTRGKTCPSATLSTTYPKWTDPGSIPGLCCERLTTNRLSPKSIGFIAVQGEKVKETPVGLQSS